MRYKFLFVGLVFILGAVLVAAADTSASFAAAPAARPAPATSPSTSPATDTEYVPPEPPGFWDSVNIFIIDIGSITFDIDLGEGYAFVFDWDDDDTKIEIKDGKIEIKGGSDKLEIKNGKVEIKVGGTKIKIKAKHVPHGKAWGWWRKNGGYLILGWTYIYNGELVFIVPEGAEDSDDLLSYEEFRKFVLAGYMTTVEFAKEFDELIGGKFEINLTDQEGVSEVAYWSPDSGYILLGWVEIKDGKLVKYALSDDIPISLQAFLDYLNTRLSTELKIEIKVDVSVK